jgi:CHAD domain-containing protein
VASPTHPPVTPLLKQRMQTLFRHLPHAMAGDVERTRSMRVAARRLRVALPLLASRPESRRVARAVKRLRQLVDAAGGSRDLDVAVVLMDETLQGGASPEALVLRRRLRAARMRARHRMAEALLDIEIASLRRDLRAVAGRKADAIFTVLARLRAARETLGRDVLSRMAALDTRYQPAALHRLRTRLRRLRYTVEVREALKARGAPAPILFKTLQDHLGKAHDTHVLAEWLSRQATAARSRGTPALATEAARLAATFRAQSKEHHRVFLATRPGPSLAAALAALGRPLSAAS